MHHKKQPPSSKPLATLVGSLPQSGFVRQQQLIGDRKKPNSPAILPFSSATLWRMVRSGEFPRPVKLSQRVTAWKVEDIFDWISGRTAN